MFGKLENNNLKICKLPLHIDGNDVYTNDPVIMLSQGWKLVVTTAQPEPIEGYYWVSGWSEGETEITQTWTQHAMPEPEASVEDYQTALGRLGVNTNDEN